MSHVSAGASRKAGVAMKHDPVIEFLDMVWNYANSEVNHSWERLNHAMRGALSLSLGAGFPFAEDTLRTVSKKYNFGRWCLENAEWIYTRAIAEGNISAARSFEAWQNRTAFIADDVDLGHHHRYAHMASWRQRERLAVGFQFPWKGKMVTVTSFADDGASLTACSYKPRPEGTYENRVEKRFKITREDIIAERADQKERQRLRQLLEAAIKVHGREKVLSALKAKTDAEYQALPIERIRKVADRFAEATSEVSV